MSDSTRQGPYLIVGLGNPGTQYAHSRHNIGFMCVDALAKAHRIALTERRNVVVLGAGSIEGKQVVVAKPRTFMNNSGEALRYLRDRFGLESSRLLVVIDDMDLPVGKLRLRASGSSGGHNGLKSIIGVLETDAFPRLRIGISRPMGGTISHVLGNFTGDEADLVEETLDRAVEAIELFITDGVQAAMNRFNQ